MQQDIIIIGAGPAGLSFARDMADTGLNITVIEKQAETVLADPPYDGREIALTHLSHRIMRDLGMWGCIEPDHISLIKSARVVNGDSPYALHFDHKECGEENLGFMISNHKIRKAAYDALDGYSNIRLLCEKEVVAVGTDSAKGWVELDEGTRLEASLIVAADSRFSATRRMMGISTSMLDFGRICIVCTMQHELPHGDTAYECFHYDRTLAILPLKNNQLSVVITLNSEDSAEVLAMSDEDFAADIQQRTQGQYGKMSLSSQLFPYPLVASFAKTFAGHRFAVIGDAAVGMHPVTAHGFNLGLRGSHTLAQEVKAILQSGGECSAQAALQRYSQKHRRACAPLYHGTNALVRLYTKDTPSARLARQILLRLGNRIGPAKRLIMNQLTETKAA